MLEEQLELKQSRLVLIVDDIEENLQVLGGILREKGIKFSLATNGKEALASVASKPPDLILLDVQMPIMDGHETCQKLKADAKTKDIPVIFLTAKTETEDIVRGFQLGAVDYVTKPFRKEELIARVLTHLDLKNSKDTIIRQYSELKYKNEELSKMINKQNEFLGMAAHDLRNPLQAIVIYSELMESQIESNRFNSAKGGENIKRILGLAQRMNSLISDLLNISAIESGTIKLDIKNENFIPILLENVEFFNGIANEKSIQLNMVEDVNLMDMTVQIDRFRMIQVIENLLNNAIKYTHSGGKVDVFCEIQNSKLITNIRDTGVGLDEDDLKSIFQSFMKLSAKPTGGESSTGLGLAIVKKIVNLHKGEIWVKSEKGKGSTFSFSLPLEINNM